MLAAIAMNELTGATAIHRIREGGRTIGAGQVIEIVEANGNHHCPWQMVYNEWLGICVPDLPYASGSLEPVNAQTPDALKELIE